MAILLVQMFVYLVLYEVQYLFYYLNEIPGFLNRNCSDSISKPKSIAQKAIVMRILSVKTTKVWEDIDHQHSVNEGRGEETAHGQQGGEVMK